MMQKREGELSLMFALGCRTGLEWNALECEVFPRLRLECLLDVYLQARWLWLRPVVLFDNGRVPFHPVLFDASLLKSKAAPPWPSAARINQSMKGGDPFG